MSRCARYICLIMLFSFALSATERSVPITFFVSPHAEGIASKRFAWDSKGALNIDFATASGKLKLRRFGKKLALDSNGDGKIDENDEKFGTNSVFKVPVTVAGKKVDFPVYIQYITSGYVYLVSRGCMKGNDGDTELIIQDTNVDGRFLPGTGDSLKIGRKRPVPFGKSVFLDTGIVSVAIENQRKIIFSDYTGKYALLNLKSQKNWNITLSLTHRKTGLYVVVNTGRPVKILPGKYNVVRTSATLMGKEELDENELLAAFDAEPPTLIEFESYNRKSPFPELKSGANEIQAGPPFSLTFDVVQGKKDWKSINIKNIKLSGKAGGLYYLEAEGESGKSLLRSFIRSGKKEKALSKMEYG